MFVSDLIQHDIQCRNVPSINEFFFPFEAQQIIQLPLYFSKLQDEFMWDASRSSRFSVKNLYHFLNARHEVYASHNSTQDIDCKTHSFKF